MLLNTEKVIILVSMFVATMLFGFLPHKLVGPASAGDRRWKLVLSLSSCFSGGVFVGACLLDLFVEVNENVRTILVEIKQTYDIEVDYPVANFLIVLGFFLVLFIEQSVISCKDGGRKTDLEAAVTVDSPLLPGRTPPHRLTPTEGSPLLPGRTPPRRLTPTEGSPLLPDRTPPRRLTPTEGSPLLPGRTPPRRLAPTEGSPLLPGRTPPRRLTPTTNTQGSSRSINDAVSLSAPRTSNTETGSMHGIDNADVAHTEDDGHPSHSHLADGIFNHSTLRAILLLIALSFHSLFEGLALGLQETKHQLVSLFVAVIGHKGVMAFALGCSIAQSQLTTTQLVTSLLVFSFASPVGMAIGIGVANLKQSLVSDIVNAVLQGLSGGTFLYITFFEVLPHEMNKPGHRLLKVLCVLLGFACISGLVLIAH